jgi:hypothetical protein
MRIEIIASMLGMSLLCGTPALAEKPNEGRDMMRGLGFGGLKGKKLQKAIERAEAFPLGSEQNPVRANMPQGERAYLSRLRCADGSAASFERAGSVGDSPYGNIMDLYRVQCGGAAPAKVYMDMYHSGEETRSIPDFTIQPE